MYFAYIRSLLEYSDVWDTCSLESKKLLDAVHVEAARIVTGATNCAILTDYLWILIGNRSKLGEISINLPPSTKLQTNNYALRNADYIQSFRSNSNLFSDSFFPSTIKAWNSLPNEAREIKTYLNRNKLQSPYYFDTGSPLGQTLHVRLRLQCSALLAKCKTIVGSPSVSTLEVLKMHITYFFHFPHICSYKKLSP